MCGLNNAFIAAMSVQPVKNPLIRVLPGESMVSTDGTGLCTILGSCVSVCLFDPSTNIGGMNHFMLATPGFKKALFSESKKYGSHAMTSLLKQMLLAGANQALLIARVFGGGKVLPSISDNKIGLSNTRLAIEYLQDQQIPISSIDVLDKCYRRIEFWPASGQVYIKKGGIEVEARQ